MKHRAEAPLNKLILISICFSFITFIFFSSIVKAQGETPFFRSIGTENGLSHDKVNCIMQDKRGFLWFGTEDGLNRYDGRFFTIFKNQPNDTTCVSGNIITDLHEDKNGIIWIATADGGLTRYNYQLPANKQFKQYKYGARVANGIPENNINKIAEDDGGNLWLATGNNYVARFNKNSQKFDIPVKKGPRSILSLAIAGKDTLWVGRAGGGLMKINTRTLQYKVDDRYNNLYSKLPHTSVASIFKSSDNTMWFGAWDKTLYTYEQITGTEKAYKPTATEPDVPADEIVSFTEDKRKSIWMGSQSTGLTVYDRGAHKFTSYQHNGKDGSLIDNHVNAVYTDRSGIVWIGTDNGLSIHDPVYSPFQQYFLPKEQDGRDITIYDFYRDDQYNLWIATSEGIYIKRQGKSGFEHRKISFNGQKLAATKFFIDKDKTFYLGTDYTLFKYDPQTNQVALLPNTASDMVMKKLISSRIVSIVRDTIDTHPVLVVSPYGHYMTYYDLAEQKWISRVDSVKKIIRKLNIQDNLIKKFYKDKKGGLWLATDRFGLGDWQQGTKPIRYFTNDMDNNSSISSNDVYDIEEDKIGNLWISTYGGGLNYFNTSVQKFMHIKGSSNLTEGLQADLRGNIWMICNGHMHEYNPLTKVYSCYDLPNLKNNGGVKGYIYKDSYGNLYAGGMNFYISFSPVGIRKIANEPDVYFTDFKIFNTSYSQLLQDKTIRLNHAQNYFSLEFSAPEYSSNHIHYDYMLEGFDKDWVDADRRNVASYSNLAGGKYLFKVRASNWKGSYVDKYISITIIINPPFWLQWWFYCLLILVIASICYLLYRLRISEFLKRQSIRNGIAQDLHDHIGSTLSSISIYSKVAKIYHQQHKEEKLKEVLHTIGETANETITEMSDIVWTINPKNDHMNNIVQKIQSYAQPLCVAQNIQFTFNYDNKVSKLTLEMATRKNFFLILKETINNAIKHSGCKNLTVDIRLNNYYLELLIQDDGVGFDTNIKHIELSTSRGGNGLTNIKSRAEELGAKLKIKSEVNKGTKISLVFSIL
ncbi:MAG: two-component regulator propeller domain-containing protein [Mucilaginibacter sp.]|uniref:ligand-binding sensor domain-containing protein n=1 Tax=Mucilaginibacter sp. TaxID=1882438 RepID=UPI0031A47FDA